MLTVTSKNQINSSRQAYNDVDFVSKKDVMTRDVTTLGSVRSKGDSSIEIVNEQQMWADFSNHFKNSHRAPSTANHHDFMKEPRISNTTADTYGRSLQISEEAELLLMHNR